MMPNGWITIKLKEAAGFRRGSFPQPYGLPEWYDDVAGFPFVQVYDVGTNGKLKPTTKRKISQRAAEASVFVPVGSILITIQGSIGRVAISQYEAYVDRTLLIIKTLSPRIDKVFFSYILRELFEKEAKKAPGGTIKTITKEALSEFELTLPPKKEQEKIAKILSTWDEASEKVETLINEKKRKMAYILESTIKDVSSKKHFKSLSEIAEIVPSNVNKKSQDGESQVLLCNYMDVYKNRMITSNLDFMQATATPAEISKFMVKKGDVIITKDSETPQDIAIPSFVAEDIDNLVCGYHLTLIRGNPSKVLGHYLYYYFLTVRAKYYFFTMANGATRFGLSVDSVKDCQIPIPDLIAQRNIVSALEIMEQEIELFKSYQNVLQGQKYGLLQQLLTGKKRVRVD